MKQQIISCLCIEKELSAFLRSISYDGLFLLMDENTKEYCFPLIREIPEVRLAKKIIIPPDEKHKNISEVVKIWQFLSENGASRKSLLIILGGGMLTDLGGFAAASFKRGIRFINIPTTVLGAVDAAVGGKTGINFDGLKNEIGVFQFAEAVLIDSRFFNTLDYTALLSGYAEMLKHALLTTQEDVDEILSFDLETLPLNPLKKPFENENMKPLSEEQGQNNYKKLNKLLFKSIMIKEEIVEKDPKEMGIRKALNLGHTFGHAFESFSHERNQPVPHGYAVAWGIVCELYLSLIKFGFDPKELMRIFRFVKENYGIFPFDCSDYQRLYELMRHDKKNEYELINFTLLESIGDIRINQTASQKEIDEAFDFLREGQ